MELSTILYTAAPCLGSVSCLYYLSVCVGLWALCVKTMFGKIVREGQRGGNVR